MAVTFVREIRAEIRQIGRNPMHYRLRPEYGKDVRVTVVGRYVILFRGPGKTVRIERSARGGRDLPALFLQ
jgi:plasmid stabilization system protein ParE